jgi:hypothetical protein
MTVIIKKSLRFSILILLLGLFFTSKTNAQTFQSASDTLTTSRPSAATWLSVNQAGNTSQATVADYPGNIYSSALWLASDSAMLLPDTGQLTSFATVASVSASSSNQRTVFFTANVTNAHHQGTTMITPVTATHMIKFIPSQPIPVSGKIIIQFPGAGSNSASPSATGFAFNNESAAPTDVTCSNISAGTVCGGTGSYPTNSFAVASNQLNTFTITLGSTTGITAGQTVVINIGCNTANNTTGACTGSAPRLVNPTKGPGALGLGTGTADTWNIQLTSQNASSITLDTTKVLASTVESVQVQGVVEPYITFTIAGVNNGTSACGDTTNTGIASTATFVNMGAIGATINISAQTLSVTTNANNGYTITATSSGKFINPINGFFFPEANGGSLSDIDTPAPARVTAGTTSFGIHPCGTDVSGTLATLWGSGTTGDANTKYSNPYNTGTGAYYANLARLTTLPPSARTTTVEYEATAATSVPAGTYVTAFTYVATPTF